MTTTRETSLPLAVSPAIRPARDEDFRRLFDAEVSYVWKTLRRLGIPPSDVEDVAHEVFVTVFRKFDDFDRSRQARPWLFGIAYRVAIAERRRARHRYETISEAPTEPADPRPLADVQIEANDVSRLVSVALDSVEMGRRAVLILHDLDGQTMRDIAESLDIPVNTAYSRLRLAREELKAALQRLSAKRGRR